MLELERKKKQRKKSKKAKNWSYVKKMGPYVITLLSVYVLFVDVLHSPISFREIREFYRTWSGQIQSAKEVPKLSAIKSLGGEKDSVRAMAKNQRSVSKPAVKSSNVSVQASPLPIADTLKSGSSRPTSDSVNSQSDDRGSLPDRGVDPILKELASLRSPFDSSGIRIRPNLINPSVDSSIEDLLKGRTRTSLPPPLKPYLDNKHSTLPIVGSNLNDLNSIPVIISDLVKSSHSRDINSLPSIPIPTTNLIDRSIINLSDLPRPSVHDSLHPALPSAIESSQDILKGLPPPNTGLNRSAFDLLTVGQEKISNPITFPESLHQIPTISRECFPVRIDSLSCN